MVCFSAGYSSQDQVSIVRPEEAPSFPGMERPRGEFQTKISTIRLMAFHNRRTCLLYASAITFTTVTNFVN